jgi:hypothetical protein
MSRNVRDGHSDSPSLRFHFSSLLPHHRILHLHFVLDFTFSTDPDFTGSVAIAVYFPQDLFMQPEPTVVSPNSPPIDSSPINSSSTQHGHDLDDAQVSGFPPQEASDSADVSGMPIHNLHAYLKDSFTPPDRVSQYENAGSSPRQSDDVGFRVTFAEKPEVLLEAFPNGNYL